MPELQLHGQPSLRRDDGRVLALAPREAALLAWLHLEGTTPRAPLAGRLWPGGDEAKARANLRQTLVRLRRSAGDVLAEDASGLRLAAGVTVAAPGPARLLGALEFDDAPDFADWLAQRRDAARRAHLREQLAAARGHLAQGALDAALAAADAVLASDAAVEEAHRLRMEVFYLRGDRAAAVTAWDDCRHALRSAFGITPGMATNELGRLVLASSGAPPPADGTLPLPAALRRPPQMVGRAEVLAQIGQALALGRAVVVSGVGGIGKSRLLAEAAAAQAPALSVSARPGDALLPGALVSRLLAAAIEGFAPPLDSATQADIQRLLPGGDGQALQSALEHRRVLAALARALRACQSQGLRLLLVDDLQYADDSSLAALQVVVGGWIADPQAALPLFGARGDALPAAASALLSLLEGSGRCTRIELAPLQAADLRGLLHSLQLQDMPDADTLAPALLAQVGGNPAFVLESLKQLWLAGFAGWQPGQPLPVPATLLDSLRQRLQRLPAEALQLAQLAALAGSQFSLALAASALGRPLLQLGPLLVALQDAQVFHGSGFSHDLVAEAVQRSLPAALLAPLHRLVAEHLAAHAGPAAAVAHHWLAAGDAAAAVPWQLQAARQARARWQMADAAAAFDAAARGMDGGEASRAERLLAWRDAARCWLWASHDDAALAALQAAEPLARSAAEQAQLRAVRTVWQFNAHRFGDAVASAETLIAELDTIVEALQPAVLADAVRVIAAAVPYGVDITRALALAAKAQACIGERDDDAARVLDTARGGLLHWASLPLDAAAALAAARQRGERSSDPGPRVMVGNQLLRVRHALGDLAGARAEALALLQLAGPLELGVVFQADVMHVLAMVEVASGDAAAGMARFDTVWAWLERTGQPLPDIFVTSRALACISVGRHDAAVALLAGHPPAGRPGMGLQDLGYHLTQARLALARGTPAAPWLALAVQASGLPPGLLLQREVAIAGLQPGDPDHLATLAQDLRRRGLLGMQRVVESAAARAALGAGRKAAAVQHARNALALVAQVDGWLDEPASAWLAAAEVLAACGLADEAAAAAAQGAAWVQRGAQQWTDDHDRSAWLQGNPLHRRLLQLGG